MNKFSAFLACFLLGVVAPAYANVPSLPRDGLIAHFDAGLGVEQRKGRIVAWYDQSGARNNLTASGALTLETRALGLEHPAVVLGNPNDALVNLDPTGLVGASGDRTLVVLFSHNRVGARLGYGRSGCRQFFGLSWTPTGHSGGLTGNCTKRSRLGLDEVAPGRTGWQVRALVHRDGILHQFVEGRRIERQVMPMNSAVDRIDIGVDQHQTGGALRIAAIALYDRALTESELAVAHWHLYERFPGTLANGWQIGSYGDVPTSTGLRLWHHYTPSGPTEIGFRTNAADGCWGSWHPSGTTGLVTLRAPDHQPLHQGFSMNCWNPVTSQDATLVFDPKPVELAWLESPDSAEVSAYRYYIGTRAGVYDDTRELTPNSANRQQIWLAPGTYHIAMTAIDHAGQEGPLSEDLRIVVE
ncbi:MAG: hypothetical protein AAF515_14020 [Pseudomonadota bacterium]